MILWKCLRTKLIQCLEDRLTNTLMKHLAQRNLMVELLHFFFFFHFLCNKLAIVDWKIRINRIAIDFEPSDEGCDGLIQYHTLWLRISEQYRCLALIDTFISMNHHPQIINLANLEITRLLVIRL